MYVLFRYGTIFCFLNFEPYVLLFFSHKCIKVFYMPVLAISNILSTVIEYLDTHLQLFCIRSTKYAIIIIVTAKVTAFPSSFFCIGALKAWFLSHSVHKEDELVYV